MNLEILVTCDCGHIVLNDATVPGDVIRIPDHECGSDE